MAAIATGCAIGIAAAQTPPAAMAPHDLLALVPYGVPQGGGHLNTAASFPLGWNTQTCATSVWFTDGANNQFIYAFNTNNTFFFARNNLYAGNTLLHVCDTTHSYGVFIVNGATGRFTEIQTKRPD